jgi:hypothetical protein
MLHMQVPDGGMVRMEHIAAAPVPPRDSLVLAPGGTHLMLVNLSNCPRQAIRFRVVRVRPRRVGGNQAAGALIRRRTMKENALQ